MASDPRNLLEARQGAVARIRPHMPSAVISPYTVGRDHPLLLIAGPCVLETRDRVFRIAEHIARATRDREVQWVFKASFDKANRTSLTSQRGPGIQEGLRLLSDVRNEFEVPVTTDIHLPEQAAVAAEVVDLLQVPAFLCRQTDLLVACAATQRPVNVKKGQFLAPEDCEHIAHKLVQSGANGCLLTERGTTFGYRQLVVDMAGLPTLRRFAPTVFDATHSTQRPGGLGHQSGGDPSVVPTLARAAVAAGVDGLFIETHDEPSEAWSDAATQYPVTSLGDLLDQVIPIHQLRSANP